MTHELLADIKKVNTYETRRILKNVVVVSLAFMVQFTAYSGAANLQSSINAEAGLGTATLTAIFAGLIFSTLFLPVVFIKWVGTKWTICLSFLNSMPFIAAHFKPTFYTMIPAGILAGLGGGPLWCANSTYLSVLSKAHSKITKVPAEALLARFMGLFYMISTLNELWGNLISSLVLTSGNNAAAVTSLNASQIPELCGANFLPAADAGDVLTPQPPERIHMIAGIYLACVAGAALIVAVGLDSMKRYDSSRSSEPGPSGVALLVVTLKLLREPNPRLLVIVCAFIGFQEAFFCAEITSAFVSCAIGTGSVGFVMMSFGMASAVGCLATGYLAKVTGRLPLIGAATMVFMALFFAVLTWKLQANSIHIMYIIAVPWGVCNSVFIVVINACFGTLFSGREEASYAIFHLSKALGSILAYVVSPHLRTSSKTYLMAALLVVGVAGYFIVEIKEKMYNAKTKKNKDFKEILSYDVQDKPEFLEDLLP